MSDDQETCEYSAETIWFNLHYSAETCDVAQEHLAQCKKLHVPDGKGWSAEEKKALRGDCPEVLSAFTRGT